MADRTEFSFFGKDFPAVDWEEITPADSDLTRIPRSLYIGTSGDLAIVSQNGNDVIFPNVPVGVFRVQPLQVKSTGTAASNIIALY